MKKVGKSGAKLEFYAQLNWLHCSSGLLYPPEKPYFFPWNSKNDDVSSYFG